MILKSALRGHPRRKKSTSKHRIGEDLIEMTNVARLRTRPTLETCK